MTNDEESNKGDSEPPKEAKYEDKEEYPRRMTDEEEGLSVQGGRGGTAAGGRPGGGREVRLQPQDLPEVADAEEPIPRLLLGLINDFRSILG